MLAIVLLLVGSFDLLHAETRACTKKDFCIPVPLGTCDKSLCKIFTLDELASFGANGLNVLTWNIGQSPVVQHCPLHFNLKKQESYDGMVSVHLAFSLNSGPYCNISTTTTKELSCKPDPYTGVTTEFALIEAGDIYDACMIYFKPGEAFVYRTCRLDPPPPYGEECASIYAVEAANGNYNRDDLNNFLQVLGVDFPQNEVDCLEDIPS